MRTFISFEASLKYYWNRKFEDQCSKLKSKNHIDLVNLRTLSTYYLADYGAQYIL